MQADIVTLEKFKYGVFPREGAPVRYDGGYKTECLFGPATEDECIDWCESNGIEYRMRRRAALLPERFVHDLEDRCNKWRKALDENANRCGMKLASDVIYRASAAWKENPTHYAYLGDFGGSARIVVVEEGISDSDALLLANQYLNYLFGAATAAWELGYILTFDENGKHTIFGNYPQWVTVDVE